MVKASEKPSAQDSLAPRLSGAEHLPLIGLVGGVASGKSLVARQLCECGAALLDADSAGHEVLRLPEVVQAAHQRWGNKVFGPDGQIDRAALARVVFEPGPRGSEEREFLEQLTHPCIGRLISRQAAELTRSESVAALVLDAPVMMESGWDHICDRVVFVDTPREVRLARVLARGWSEQDFAAREDVQKSLDAKRARADVVIDNSGSSESTRAQVERFWHSLIGEFPPDSSAIRGPTRE